MVKEIKYTGYEASTPDNLASDGSLSAAIGLVNQDGGMRAATSPNEMIKIPDGYEIVFRHRVSSGQTNTILRKGQTFSWFQYDYKEASIGADFTDEIEANREVDKIFVPSMPEDLRNKKYSDWKRAVERSRNWER